MRRQLALALLAGLLLLPLAPVYADSSDNFDGYAPGTTFNPPTSGQPWTSTPTNAGCLSGAVTSVTTAQSVPNVFRFTEQSSCYASSQTDTLSETVNSTSLLVTVKFYVALASGSSPGAGAATLTAKVGSTTVYTVDISTLTATMTLKTGTATVSSGTTYPVQFVVATTIQASSYSFNLDVDNVVVKGANVVVSPNDVVLLDYSTRLGFNVSNYAGSKVQVTYPVATTCLAPLSQSGSSQCTMANVVNPYLQMPLSGATLLTVFVGTSYYRTLVPTSTTHQAVYLDPPGAVVNYYVTITDLTNTYGSGATFRVSNGATVVVSGYLDAASSFVASVQPGTYTLTLVSGSSTYSQNLNLGPATAVSVQITSAVQAGSLGAFVTSQPSAGWNCTNTGVVFYYRDAASPPTTTKVTFNLVLNGAVAQTTTLTGSATSYWSATLPAAKGNQGNYFSQFVVTNAAGVNYFGPTAVLQSIPTCGGGHPPLIPYSFTFPAAVYGADVLLKSSNAYGQAFDVFIIVLTMGIFAARSSKIGFIAVAVESAFFYFSGLGLSYDIVYVMLASSFLGFLVYLRRRPI